MSFTPAPTRGYKALYRRTVTQAPEGCDFDFLMGAIDHA
jgi:dihydroxy-acid dehydratase